MKLEKLSAMAELVGSVADLPGRADSTNKHRSACSFERSHNDGRRDHAGRRDRKS